MKSKRGLIGDLSEDEAEDSEDNNDYAEMHKVKNARYLELLPVASGIDRETIREFWLELGEKERRELVRVEREAMLRKLREEQKYACTCNVCVRRRYAGNDRNESELTGG